MDQPIFIFVTAGNCGVCSAIKPMWADPETGIGLRSKIDSTGVVDIIEIETPLMSKGRDIFDQYHPDLYRFIRWYPTFIMVTAESWNNKSKKLEGIVFNGKMEDGDYVNDNGPFSASYVYNWVMDNYNKLDDVPIQSYLPLDKINNNSIPIYPETVKISSNNYDQNYICTKAYRATSRRRH